MATIGLMALDPEFARVLWDALEDEGHTVTWIRFGPNAVRRLVQEAPDVLVFNGHEYLNTRRFLEDVRRVTALPVVVLGPARPHEVPRFPHVVLLGPRYDLNQIVEAVQRVLAAGPTP